MIRQRLLHQLISIGLIFVIGGCNALAMPIPPTSTPKPTRTLQPTSTPRPTFTATPLPPTCTPNAASTLSTPTALGDDFVFLRQVDNNGNPQAYGGVTSNPGESSVQIGGSNSAGFWKGEGGKIFNVALLDENSNKVFAVLDLKGVVRWDKDGNLIEGQDNFLRLEFASNQGKVQDITGKEIRYKGLLVTIEDGSTYFLYNFTYDFYGMIRQQTCA